MNIFAGVQTPWYYNKKQIQDFVEEKRKWIFQKLQDSEEQAIIKKDSSLLMPIKIFGKNYELNVFYKNIKNPTLDLEINYINISLPMEYRNTDNKELLNKILDKMYFSIAKNEIEHIMEKIRVLVKIAPEDFEIKKINKALASCSFEAQSISIDPSIVIYDKSIIEFIILHQFCHLKYKTHAKKFIEIMKKHTQNYGKLYKATENLKF